MDSRMEQIVSQFNRYNKDDNYNNKLCFDDVVYFPISADAARERDWGREGGTTVTARGRDGRVDDLQSSPSKTGREMEVPWPLVCAGSKPINRLQVSRKI